LERVWKRTRRTYALLLARHDLFGRHFRGIVGMPLEVGFEAIGRWKLDVTPLLRTLEIERRGQVTGNGSPPPCDVGLEQVALAAAKSRLEELDHRRVVEELRVDVSAFAPWRHDQHRDALAKPDRTGLEERAVDSRGSREDFILGRHRGVAVRGCHR